MQTLYFFPMVSSIFLSIFFLVQSQLSQIGCLPYFHTWCGSSANLKCRSEMYYTQLAGISGAKKSPSWHHRTNLSGYIFATKAHIDNRKNTLNNNTSPTCCYNMVNFGPLAAEICWLLASLRHPGKFQRFSRLGSVTAWHSSSGR